MYYVWGELHYFETEGRVDWRRTTSKRFFLSQSREATCLLPERGEVRRARGEREEEASVSCLKTQVRPSHTRCRVFFVFLEGELGEVEVVLLGGLLEAVFGDGLEGLGGHA